MQGSLNEQITRSLAYMLRHQPEEFDLELDAEGWGDIVDVVDALCERLGEEVSEEDVHGAIESGDRPRYEITDGRVRALYGHSIEIEPGAPAEPPEFLYVGIGSRDADRAERSGLRAGRRTFLHLALTEDDARESGRRAAPEYTVVTVRARDAWDDGVDFYDRKSLFLAESIPVDFLDVGELYDDGVRRDGARSRGGDRGRGRGRRGGGGGRGRGRGRGRDRDDDYQPRLREEPAPAGQEQDDDNRRERFAEEPPKRERAPRAKAERAPRAERSAPAGDRGRSKPAEAKSSAEASEGSSGGGGFGAGL